MSTDVTPYEQRFGALTVGDVRSQVNLIQHVMKEVMRIDEHYGVIPGTKKPSLLKAGAEKLCLTFRLDPQYETSETRDGQHLTVVSKCTVYHIPSGQRFGSGMGSCSTKESKYAYRQANRKCPSCGKESIIKGREEYGGGWICFKKKDGCGAKYADGDRSIEGQETGRVPNEDVADQYNTVLKMANKRSLIAAVLNVTAASDIFTQDMEDLPQAPPIDVTPEPVSERPKKRKTNPAPESAASASSGGATSPSSLSPVSGPFPKDAGNLDDVGLPDPEHSPELQAALDAFYDAADANALKAAGELAKKIASEDEKKLARKVYSEQMAKLMEAV